MSNNIWQTTRNIAAIPKSGAGRRKRADVRNLGVPDRRQFIIGEAAKLFSHHGYDATSMRDLASATDMTIGTLYWYFSSKEELFSAVHAAGIKAIQDAVEQAIEGIKDPWDRLEAATKAHCRLLLNPSDAVAILSPTLPASLGAARRTLLAQRDKYEKLIRVLFDALEFPNGVDRNVLQLHFLVALNGTPHWYKAGGRYSPEAIGQQLVLMIRPQAAQAAGKQRRPHPNQ